MSRVLVVATSPNTRGGVTSVVNAYKNSFVWQKWDCMWISSHIDRGLFVKVYYFLVAFINYARLLPKFDIIHVHLSGPLSCVRKGAFIWLAKAFQKKVIVHFHAFGEASRIDSRYFWLYRSIFKEADLIIALSNGWKFNIIKDLKLDEAKVSVLYNPCVQRQFVHRNKKKQILFAGTLNKRKNYKSLIKAFSIILDKHPDWELVFAGNGELVEARKLSEKLGISSRVQYLGWVRGADKDKVFSEASVFCLPSFAEGFPMAVLDAWAYGLPVISTEVGGISDVAVHGENIVLIDPHDPKSIACRIESLIEDNDLMMRLEEAARDFSQGLFSVDTICGRLDRIYASILE